MSIFLVFLATAMSLLPRGPADADEAPPVGVILEAGEIDSNRVEVGAFAVVIHGQGERHPVSREWEQLVTTRGYVQAVDAENLTLARARDPGQDRIALKRIQTLVLVGALPPTSADQESRLADIVVDGDSRDGDTGFSSSGRRNTIQAQTEPADSLGLRLLTKPMDGDSTAADAAAVAGPTPSRAAEDSVQATASRRLITNYSQRPSWREERDIGFAFKCGIGAYVGILSAVAGFLIFLPFAECVESDGDSIFCDIEGPPFQAAKIGFLAGTASGVTLVDPYRKFTYLYALAGTWVGEQVARELADRMGYPPRESYVAMAFYIGVPAVMAALASEVMRGFHKEPRFSVGLAPDRGGSMSVVATLRF